MTDLLGEEVEMIQIVEMSWTVWLGTWHEAAIRIIKEEGDSSGRVLGQFHVALVSLTETRVEAVGEEFGCVAKELFVHCEHLAVFADVEEDDVVAHVSQSLIRCCPVEKDAQITYLESRWDVSLLILGVV